MTRRSRGREVALQVLYQIEQNAGVPVAEVHQFINRRVRGDAKLVEFTQDLIAGVKEHQAQIDEMIEQVAENWRLDRMAAIDRNILRLGVLRGPLPPRDPVQGGHQRGPGAGQALQHRPVEPVRQRHPRPGAPAPRHAGRPGRGRSRGRRGRGRGPLGRGRPSGRRDAPGEAGIEPEAEP